MCVFPLSLDFEAALWPFGVAWKEVGRRAFQISDVSVDFVLGKM